MPMYAGVSSVGSVAVVFATQRDLEQQVRLLQTSIGTVPDATWGGERASLGAFLN